MRWVPMNVSEASEAIEFLPSVSSLPLLFFKDCKIGSFFSSFQEKGEIFMKLISEQTALYLININYP